MPLCGPAELLQSGEYVLRRGPMGCRVTSGIAGFEECLEVASQIFSQLASRAVPSATAANFLITAEKLRREKGFARKELLG